MSNDRISPGPYFQLLQLLKNLIFVEFPRFLCFFFFFFYVFCCCCCCCGCCCWMLTNVLHFSILISLWTDCIIKIKTLPYSFQGSGLSSRNFEVWHMFLVWNVFSALEGTLLKDFNFTLIWQVVLCRVVAVKRLPVHHPLYKLYFISVLWDERMHSEQSDFFFVGLDSIHLF